MVSESTHIDRDLTSGVLVGRWRELEELREGLDRALAGSSGFVLLTGEPGIGKTRLASELARDAQARGACVLWGRCWEGGGAPAYWPWLQVLRGCERSIADPVDLVGTSDAHQLRQFIPGPTVPEESRPAEQAVSEHARFRFFDAMAQLLASAACRVPLVLVMDDIHAADEPSLQLLRFVARHLHDARVLILATYRDCEIRMSATLTRRFAALAREGRHLHLRGLGVDEVGQCMAAVSLQDPPATLVDAVHRTTDGNPFFVDAITRMLITAGRLGGEQCDLTNFQMPEEVREAIRQRIEPLGADVRAVLEIASVCGREFEVRVVERVAALRRSSPVGGPLEAALRAGMIHHKAQAAGSLCFVHNLVADTLYQDQKPDLRAALHRDVAGVVEELGRGCGDLPAAQLAHHYLEAGLHGDIDKAIQYAELAGRRAFALHGYEEAAHWYARALRVVDSAAGGRAARCRLLIALGDAHRCAGDDMSGEPQFRAALDLARQLGSSALFAHAAIGLSGSLAETGRVDETLVAVLREALQMLPADDSLLRVALLGRLTSALYFSPTSTERQRAGAEAIEMARRLGDPSGLILVLRTRHVDLRRPGCAQQRLAIADELLPLAERVGESEAMFEARYWRAGALLELADVQRAVAEIEVYRRRANERRQLNEQWEGALLRTAATLLWGRFEEAEQLSEQALAIGQRSEALNALQFFSVQTFLRLYEQDRLAEIAAAVSAFVEQYPQLPIWRCGRAFLHAALGNVAEARTEFDEIAEREFSCIPRDLNWLAAMSFLAEVCAAVEDSDAAKTLYAQLTPYAECNVVIAMSVACRGSLSHYLGLLAATRGQFDAAIDHFERAMVHNARMGALPALAHSQFRCAQALLREERRRADRSVAQQARRLLRDALATARKLGMVRLESAIVASGAMVSDMPTAIAPEAVLGAPSATFRREEGGWLIDFDGSAIRLAHTKGLLYLALLLANPGRTCHVNDLLELAESHHEGTQLGDLRSLTLSRAGRGEIETASDLRHAGPATLVSSPSIDAVQQRLLESRRVAVSKAISLAMQAIGAHHPSLRQYLASTIRTGRVCTFTPSSARPIGWRL